MNYDLIFCLVIAYIAGAPLGAVLLCRVIARRDRQVPK